VSADTQHPKVVLIGAGSLFFGRQCIWQMTHSPVLNGGTLALVDTDTKRVEKMAALAKAVVADSKVDLKVEFSADRKDVLEDADFVVLSFARDSVKYRGIDCEISAKYGVRMCSGDTIGPGGIFRTLREFPVIMECVEDIRKLCPGAWVINYINPTAANGIGLRRFAPDLKSFALCDGLHMPHIKRRYAVRAGLVESEEAVTDEVDAKFDFRVAGVNHFTWVIKAEYEGRDVMADIADHLRREAATETDGQDKGAKAVHNWAIGYELYKAFGIVPACVGHTKEYVRFWQGHNTAPETLPPLSLWETELRYARHAEMWQQVDDFISGKTPISEYMTTFGPDHATDVIENMHGGLGKRFYVNTFNQGAVTNMADEAFLELYSDIDMKGIRPRPVGEMPRGILALTQQVLDTHELTALAAVTGDRAILRRAMLTDPICNNIGDADGCLDDFFRLERNALPACWF